RMRSAFNKDDASLNVRMKNQKLLLEIMDDLPFGAGIGMGGGKAKDYAPDALISQIPTDSWYVQLWVETGVVGFALYFFIQIFIIFYGVYIIIYKLKTKIIKGYMTAIVSALLGMLVAAYGNEIWGQLPNIFILTVCQAFLFTSPKYDRELIEKEVCKAK
ncbi:MAG: O-antigen ligase family protein, partial [Rikenellaceae bacterium]